LIYKAIETELRSKTNFAWIRKSEELLQVGGFNPVSDVLVIDLTPKRADSLLARVCGAAGFTYGEWTPFALMLKVITVNSKDRIDFHDADRACTILYAQGGWDVGNDHGWIRAGGQGLTSAILWEDAFRHIAIAGRRWIEDGVVR